MRNLKAVMDFIRERDMLGLTYGDCIEYMSFEEATPYLNDEYIKKVEEGEETWDYKEYIPDRIIEDIKDYLPFAWDKANNCRGISAWRSILHFQNWFYMLGDKDIDKLVDTIGDYSYYGKPQLVLISELVGFDQRKYDDGIWRNSELGNGLDEKEINLKIQEARDRVSFEKLKEKIEKWKNK